MATESLPPRSSPDEFEKQAAQAAPGLLREFVDFILHSKKYWLLPIVLLLLGLAVFLVASGSIAAPWLYTLF